MGARLIEKDHGFYALFKRAQDIHGTYAKVGLLADSDKGAEQPDGKGLSVAEIGVCNEFGTTNAPKRPFLMPTFDKLRDELTEDGKRLMEQVLMGKVSIDKAVNVLGLKLSTEIKKAITSNVPPPNAPSTLQRKLAKGNGSGDPKTLIDTGRMLNAVTWAIKRKGEE